MHKPILLLIRKAIQIPTKSQRRHLFTHRWEIIRKIGYQESQRIFSEIGGGPIRNDGQFAKLISESYGEGEYSVLSWMKGRKGFKKFIHLSVDSEGYFQQIKKARVYKPKRKFDLEAEYLRAKQEYLESRSEADWDELQDIQRKIDRADHAQGPYPYLESLQSRYRAHQIEGWEGFDEIEVEQEDQEEVNNEEAVQEIGFWSTPIEQEEIEQEPEKEPEYSLW
jgi:hypothetical protein